MTTRTKPLPDTKFIRQYLQNPHDAYATVLVMLVLHRYGRVSVWDDDDDEAWSPQTRRMELEQDFGQVPAGTQNLLEAGVAVCTTNFFYKDIRRFIVLVNTICGDGPDSIDEPPDAAEVLWALTEAALLWPPDQDPNDTEFSPDIRRLIGEVTHDEGITKPFDLLRLGYRPRQNLGMTPDMFTEDPDMAMALGQGPDTHSEDMRAMVLDNLTRLHQQLHTLFGRELPEQMQAVDKRLQTAFASLKAG